jgi:hypothetical protein
MNNKNRWIVSKDDVLFSSWRGRVFSSSENEDPNAITRRIYELAIKEELYRVVKKEKQGDKSEVLVGITNLDFGYSNDLEDTLEDEGALFWYNECEEQCKISYYNLDGQITTEWIGCFYDFYMDLMSEEFMELDKTYTYSGALPVDICCEFDDDGYQTFTINLHSDIWFPQVVGWLNSEEPFYDNHELYSLNTNRLNRFLQRTKELTLSLGGKWELVGDKPVAVDEYDPQTDYYYFSDTKVIDTKIIYVDGIKKEVYPPLSKYIGVENISPECQISQNGIALEVNPRSRNRWCGLTNYALMGSHIPEWEAVFPSEMFATHKGFWPLVKTIIEVGQQEEVFRIFAEEEEFNQFIRDVDSGILSMPELEILQSGIAGTRIEKQLVTDNLPEYIRNIQGMTKISYYDKDGKLMDKYMGKRDFGRFLYNYHLGSLGKNQHSYNEREFLYPYYGCLDLFNQLIPRSGTEHCSVKITLTSDIWFPIVDGYLERKVRVNTDFGADEKARYQGGFDNRELANRHTPRLNRFLSAIAAKVTEMGGEWSIGEDVDPKYKEQMTLTGIKLDI